MDCYSHNNKGIDVCNDSAISDSENTTQFDDNFEDIHSALSRRGSLWSSLSLSQINALEAASDASRDKQANLQSQCSDRSADNISSHSSREERLWPS